jgi:hypothetical protein
MTMRPFIITIIFLHLFSCATPPPTEENFSTHVQFGLADSLFAYIDIHRTDTVNVWELKSHELDSSLKMRFLAPILYSTAFNYPVDTDYFISEQRACFVAKQTMIDEFTPVIISLTGDDTEFMFYILLDKNLIPTSGVQVSGQGLCGGPDEVGDSLLRLCTVTSSIFNRTGIITSYVTEIMQPDSIKRPSLFDSVSIKYSVKPNGDIKIVQKDSLHYSRVTN